MTARAGRLSDAFSFVFGAWRVRPLGKRVVAGLSVMLMISGLVMFSYPFLTDVYTRLRQGSLQDQFLSPSFSERGPAAAERGQVLTRIIIDKIGVDSLIVEGTDPGSLRAGAGHYVDTALPCGRGNVGIAGHRTTYGKPFGRIDELVEGDTIVLEMPSVRCTYTVIVDGGARPRPRAGAAGWITVPSDGTVLLPSEESLLTLTTCHPKGSDDKRLIVRARLVGS